MTITFSGDIAVTSPIPDFSVSDIVRSFLGRADYRFCCFEVPILKDKNTPPFVKVGPTLCQHSDISKVDELFTHATIANNHIMDYGIKGCEDTINYLKKKNIEYSGAGLNYEDIYKPLLLQKDNLKVAVLCLAESQFGCCRYKEDCQGGYAWILNPNIFQTIQQLKTECDYVVCLTHAGLEMCDYPLPEWRSCYYSLIDFGCDLIIGSHPHVIQGKEEYKGKYIYYSLGNFFFTSKSSDSRWWKSLSLLVSFTKEGIEIEEFFTSFSETNIVKEDNNARKKFLQLSSLLNKNNYLAYIEKVNKEVLKCWNEYYENYFSYPILSGSQNIKVKIFRKLFLKYIYKSLMPRVSRTMLYHNMMIDTHRFAISRAISLLNKTY